MGRSTIEEALNNRFPHINGLIELINQYAQFEKDGVIGDCVLREFVENISENRIAFPINACVVHAEALRLFLKKTKMMNENNTINPYPVL